MTWWKKSLSLTLCQIVNEFQDVIPEDLPRVPPEHEINFNVDIAPNTNPISIPPYKMELSELKELKI